MHDLASALPKTWLRRLRAALPIAPKPEPIDEIGPRNIVVPPPDAVYEQIERNNHLARFARKDYSQWGESGILDELLGRLKIDSGWCVEFGACDGKRDSNTARLVESGNWSAVYIEGNPEWFPLLQKNFADRKDVFCLPHYVSWEGEYRLDALLARTPIPRNFDLLVIDIDGNDYHVWDALRDYEPEIVVVEFNAFIPPFLDFVEAGPYAEHVSVSLSALARLGKQKGYELICVNQANAFFVKKIHYPLFQVLDNRPEAMHQVSWNARTHFFQAYDGTILTSGFHELIWKHQMDRDGKVHCVEFEAADLQVLPKGLRIFRPRLSYENLILDRAAGTLELARVPSNLLLSHRRSLHAECGEDGVLEHIFKLLNVNLGTCVDVGAFDGVRFSNTRNLVGQHGWQSLQIEADLGSFRELNAQYGSNPQVTCMHARVSAIGPGNLNEVLLANGLKPDFELLSIDVEGCDYHLWNSLRNFKPKVVIVDFNPSIPNEVSYVQPLSLSINHGSSLRAFVELGKIKGYELLAVTEWNAIFVRRDYFKRFDLPDNEIDRMYQPVFESHFFQTMAGKIFLRGCDILVRQQVKIEHESIQILPDCLRFTGDAAPQSFGKSTSLLYGTPSALTKSIVP